MQECLKFPAQKCPDILALALIESDGPLNMIRHEIISSLIPIFLGNHNNAAIILHRAWNHQVSQIFVYLINLNIYVELLSSNCSYILLNIFP